MAARYTTNGIRTLLASRKDTEHGQILVRMVICGCTLGLILLLLDGPEYSSAEIGCLVLVSVGLLLSPILFLLMLRHPQPSITRRVVAMVYDYSAITFGMILVGEKLAFAYAYLMWITVGYGLRYGARYRVAGVIASLIGFMLVIIFVDFWYEHLLLSISLWLLLGAIPSYEAGLLMRSIRQHERTAMASNAKTEFIAKMSHELRTPLNGIILLAEMLAGGRMKPADRVEAAETIGKEAMMMLGIVQEVLHISEIEAGKITVRPANTNAYNTVMQVSRLFRPMATRKDLGFEVDVTLAKKGWVLDEVYFRQVLTNVVSNAVKYTQAGVIRLEVTSSDDDAHLLIRVQDTGVGMDGYEISKLFDAYEGARTPPQDVEGSGLGMHITKSLVDAMGGEIHVTTRKGEGTVVEITIPSRPSAQQPDDQAEQDSRVDFESIVERHRQIVGGKWIMIVDDVKSNLAIVTRLMQQVDHRILPFHSPAQALESILELSPDLVLVDFHMPEMNAPEFIRRMRALRNRVGEDVPVVVMTADASTTTRTEALAAGASAVVHKPVQAADLLLAVERGISFGAKNPVGS